VTAGLREAGHEVIELKIEKDGNWVSGGQPVSVVPGQGLLGADVAFPVLHGPFGEDGATQGVLETAGIPYAGSDVLGSAVCMDKLTLKALCGFHELPQVDFVQVGITGWHEAALQLGLPVWVKPSRLGSSVGISKVDHWDQLTPAVDIALKHDPRVIIEGHCAGREIECSVLGNEKPEASLPGEIVADADWYDYEAKYTEGRMNLAVPADLDEATTTALRAAATNAFTLAGCSGLARCDFFVEDDGTIMLNEINTIPGFTQTSVYAKLWQATGIEYPDLCDRLINLAIERHEREAQHSF